MGEVVAMRAPRAPVLSEDTSYMAMAYLMGCQSPCARGHVGALAVKDGQIVASGYNKPASGRCYGAEACGAQEGCTQAVSAAQGLLDNAAPGVLLGATVYVSMPPPRAQYEALLVRGVVRIVAGPHHHRSKPDDCSGPVPVEYVEHERMALMATDALRTDHLPQRLRHVAPDRFGVEVPPLPQAAPGEQTTRNLRLCKLAGPIVDGVVLFALCDHDHVIPSLVVSQSEISAWAAWLAMPPHVRFWQTNVTPFSLLTSVSTAIQAIQNFKAPPVIFVSQEQGALGLDIWSIPPTFVRPKTKAQAEEMYVAYSEWAHTHRKALTSQDDEHIDFVPPEAPGRLPGPWSRSRAQRMLASGEPILWMSPRFTKVSDAGLEMLRREYGTNLSYVWGATLADLEHHARMRLEYIADSDDNMVAQAVSDYQEVIERFATLYGQWEADNTLPGADTTSPNTNTLDTNTASPAPPDAPAQASTASDVFGGGL